MKKPNKIYLLSTNENTISRVAFEKPILDEGIEGHENVEYIRKKALLDWAEEGSEHYRMLMEVFKDDPVFAASFGAYNAFIEKLKTL